MDGKALSNIRSHSSLVEMTEPIAETSTLNVPSNRDRAISRHEIQSALDARTTSTITYQYNFTFPNLESVAVEETQTKTSCSPSNFIIKPSSKFGIFWDFIVMLLLLYTAIITPLRAAFERESNNITLNVIVDSLFFMDIILSFFTAYETKNGAIVTNHKRIAKRYLTGWFFLDCITTFPFYAFFHQAHFSRIARIWKLAKFARLMRMVKLFKVNRAEILMNYIQYAPRVHPSAVRVTKLFFSALIFAHICACLWYAVGDFNDESDDTTWVQYRGIGNITEDYYLLYAVSFHWAIQTLTTVGYGDVLPNNGLELTMAIIMMLCGTMFFAYVTGAVASIIMSHDEIDIDFRVKMTSLADFWTEARLSTSLRRKMTSYLGRKWRKTPAWGTAILWKQILNECNTDLRYEIIRELYSDIIDTPWFHKISKFPKFLDVLALSLRPIQYPAGHYIGEQNAFISDWYVVSEGKLTLRRRTRSGMQTLLQKVYKEGWVEKNSKLMGSEILFSPRERRRYCKLFQDRIRYYKNPTDPNHKGEIFLYRCHLKTPENEDEGKIVQCPGKHTTVSIKIKDIAICDICEKSLPVNTEIHQCNMKCDWNCCNACYQISSYELHIVPFDEKNISTLVIRDFRERQDWMVKILDVKAQIENPSRTASVITEPSPNIECKETSQRITLKSKRSKPKSRTVTSIIDAESKHSKRGSRGTPLGRSGRFFTWRQPLELVLIDNVHLEEDHFQAKIRFPSKEFATEGDWLGLYEVQKPDFPRPINSRIMYPILNKKEDLIRWTIKGLGLKTSVLYNIRYFRNVNWEKDGSLEESSPFIVHPGRRSVRYVAEMGVGKTIGEIGILLALPWLFDVSCSTICRLYTIPGPKFIDILHQMEEDSESRKIPYLVYQMMLEKINELKISGLIGKDSIPTEKTQFYTNIKSLKKKKSNTTSAVTNEMLLEQIQILTKKFEKFERENKQNLPLLKIDN